MHHIHSILLQSIIFFRIKKPLYNIYIHIIKKFLYIYTHEIEKNDNKLRIPISFKNPFKCELLFKGFIKHIEIIPRKEFFSKYIFKIFIYETEEKSEKF